MNKKLFLIGAAVIIFSLGWWLLSSPRIEVQTFNQSPRQAGDYNVSILPTEKQNQVYSNLIVIRGPFRGKDYVGAYPQDAVTVTTSDVDIYARVYTNDPDTTRLKKYMN